MLKAHHRLAKDRDVKTALGRGRNFFNPNFTLKYLFSPQNASARFAVVVSTKVSKLAVKRNRIKRLVREFIKGKISQLPKADYVVIAKPQAVKLNPVELKVSLEKLFSPLLRK